MPNPRLKPWYVATCTLVVLVVITNAHEILSTFALYRTWHATHPFYLTETIDELLRAVLCCLAIYGIHRVGLRAISRELGLAAPVLPALAFGLVATSPMLIGFVLTRRVSPDLSLPALLFLTVLSPFVEEVAFRGFAFWQLYRRASCPFWLAALLPALAFGFGHVEHGRGLKEKLVIFVWAACGSALFSWLLDQWQNLWVPFAVHLCFDLWWQVFGLSELGGWFPFAMSMVAVVLAIVLTVLARRRGLLPRPVATLR